MDSAFHLLNNPALGLRNSVGQGQWRTGWHTRHPHLKLPESTRPGVHYSKSHKYYGLRYIFAVTFVEFWILL